MGGYGLSEISNSSKPIYMRENLNTNRDLYGTIPAYFAEFQLAVEFQNLDCPIIWEFLFSSSFFVHIASV